MPISAQSLANGLVNLNIVQGATFRFVISVAQDLTSSTPITLQTLAGGTIPSNAIALSLASGIILTGGNPSFLTVVLTAAQTEALPLGIAPYSLLCTLPGPGDTLLILSGQITISEV
jgi:hypothetical protein